MRPTLLPKALVQQDGKVALPARWINQDIHDVVARPVKLYDRGSGYSAASAASGGAGQCEEVRLIEQAMVATSHSYHRNQYHYLR